MASARLLADEATDSIRDESIQALAELHLRSLVLTSDKIDGFVPSDVGLWLGQNERGGDRMH
jgi:hypothetical protein